CCSDAALFCLWVLARVARIARWVTARPARFRYSDQHLTLDRARRPWRTQGVNRDRMLFGSIDRRLMLQFRGSLVTSDAGLLAYRELDDELGLTAMAGDVLAAARSGKNGRHPLAGLFRQSVFGRLAGYEDVNDAERLRHDPLTRPVGRPPHHVRRFHANFSYQAGTWTKPRRVIAKVEWHPREVYPRVA